MCQTRGISMTFGPNTFAFWRVIKTRIILVKMVNFIVLCLCCEVILHAIAAQAPGDESSFCSLSNSPSYPQNMRILYQYFNLLLPQSDAVWDQVDRDNNNVNNISGSITSVRSIVKDLIQRVLLEGFWPTPRR